MKKIFFPLLVVGLLIGNGVWAEERDANWECYNFVASQLRLSPKFHTVLASTWKASVTVDVQCTNRGRGFGALPPDVKEGDRVGSGFIDADITLTVKDLVKGRPLGGTQEVVHVEGSYGYLFQVEDSSFFDVESLTYQRVGLRELKEK